MFDEGPAEAGHYESPTCLAEAAEQRRRMSARLADLIYRFRLPLSGVIILGFFALLPLTNITEIDNDISMWISKDDPIYVTYERFREEFGGQRTLMIALRSERLFTPESLEFIRQITGDIERVDLVDRVGRDEASAPGEEARSHRERVRHLGVRAVHRRLDPADHATAPVRDQIAGGPAEVVGDGAHLPVTLFPAC